MRIGPTGNQAVYFIRYRLFGPGRYEPPYAYSIGPGHVLAAHRAKMAPPTDRCCPLPQEPRTGDHARPVAWPYDTALPSGLPMLPELPGQRLAYLRGGLPGVSPSVTATVKVWRTVTANPPTVTQHLAGAAYTTPPHGKVGSVLDVLA